MWRGRMVSLVGGLLAALVLTACSASVGLYNALIVPKDGYHVVRDVPYGDHPRQKMDLYIPDHLSGPAPVMLFFYGGSWQGGDKDMYLAFGQTFASQGVIVAVADYRVYPEVRYPTFNEDGARAFVTLRGLAQDHGGDLNRLFVVGHSAGAYIAAMLGVNPTYIRNAGGDPAWVRGVIGIAGPYDFIPLQDPKLVEIFGGDRRAETQPVTYVDGKRAPTFLAYGTEDKIVLPRNSLHLAAKLKLSDTPVTLMSYPGMGHIDILLSLAPGFPARATLRKDILNFVASQP